MVQFTHLRIAHTKISFYFGNPKSRGKICGGCPPCTRKVPERDKRDLQPNKKSGSRSTAGSFGEPAGARTQDPNIKSVVLYLLSYGFSGTITAQTVLVVQMYGIYLKMQYPKAFFSCEAPYGSFFRFCPSCHRSCCTLFGHFGLSNSTHYNLRTGLYR